MTRTIYRKCFRTVHRVFLWTSYCCSRSHVGMLKTRRIFDRAITKPQSKGESGPFRFCVADELANEGTIGWEQTSETHFRSLLTAARGLLGTVDSRFFRAGRRYADLNQEEDISSPASSFIARPQLQEQNRGERNVSPFSHLPHPLWQHT